MKLIVVSLMLIGLLSWLSCTEILCKSSLFTSTVRDTCKSAVTHQKLVHEGGTVHCYIRKAERVHSIVSLFPNVH